MVPIEAPHTHLDIRPRGRIIICVIRLGNRPHGWTNFCLRRILIEAPHIHLDKRPPGCFIKNIGYVTFYVGGVFGSAVLHPFTVSACLLLPCQHIPVSSLHVMASVYLIRGPGIDIGQLIRTKHCGILTWSIAFSASNISCLTPLTRSASASV